MSMVEPEIANNLMHEIQRIEGGTDLKRVSIISRIGMRVASADSAEMDADSDTASSSALIDLSERLTDSVEHGHLREIIVKAETGFVILLFVNEDFMLFGGVEDPLRIGFYIEYLRNAATKFAYILAGNQVTEALQKEISANLEREQRIHEQTKAPLGENFISDKSASNDMQAMEGVLDFLKDWGEEAEAPTPSKDNIIGIDQDLMFGTDGAESFEPVSISQDQMAAAQEASRSPAISSDSKTDEISEDIFAALDQIAEATPTTPIAPTHSSTPSGAITQPSQEESLPDDILAALDDVLTSTGISTPKKREKKETSYPYGIPIYKDEVPPVPLTDYVTFEIGSLTAEPSSHAEVAPNQPPTQASFAPIQEPIAPEIKLKEDGTPDFDNIGSEYDDYDIDIEEDQMLEALQALDMDQSKPEPKPKTKKNPFLR